jgi:hypothetical protein
MKNFILLFVSFFALLLFACNESTSNEEAAEEIIHEFTEDMTAEDMVFEVIESLPEYKEAAIQISALTNGQQSVSLILQEPNEEIQSYYVRVGYNQESWFETYYHFYVDPNTFEVTVEDVIEGDVVSLKTWRERNENR